MVLKKAIQTVAQLVGVSAQPVRYDDVLEEVLSHHPDAETDYLAKAYAFGAKAHAGQVRKSGEPYYQHPTAVAYHLAKTGLDLDTVAAGFLHDVLEDCPVEYKDLETNFGHDLAEIVNGVTKLGKVKFQDKAQAQAESYRKMILAMSKDLRVLIVKLADRLHNMQTLEHLNPEKQKRISKETLEIYAPLAHRIGMSQFKTELETLAFYYLEPESYSELKRQLDTRQKISHKTMDSIGHEIRAVLEKNQLESDVTSRVKSEYSIFQKLKKKQTTIEGIYDYYAFRILTDSVRECYAVLGALHERWKPIPGRFKDFIATPKPNLYQSLHTTLIAENGMPFEVQIRTHMMHRLAEEGVAAHWTYKRGRLLSVGKSEYTAWLRKLVDENKDMSDHEEFLESLKAQLVNDEILVFTPAGEIKTLPKGATPLDFAYQIHTELGHHTIGAKIDGKMTSLRSTLQTGNIVEILTSPNQRPSQEWLKIVKSHSARHKIRQWLRTEEKKKSIELGHQIFEKELKRYKIALKTISRDLVQGKAEGLGYKKLDDFYSAIGFGHITPAKAIAPFLPEGTLDKPTGDEVRESRIAKAINRLARKKGAQVTVKGQEDVLVYLAKCCSPIFGDPIVGYITRGRGVAVHKRDCAGLQRSLNDPERRIEVEWDKNYDNPVFSVRVLVHTEERPGMLLDITQALKDAKTNVRKFQASVNVEKNLGVFDIVIEVNTINHLENVFKHLRKIKGVLSQQRVK
ncbi:MAG: bifunctional (p)ppGpp synthetase/guanosine-3',5'-bis(diphosphate) 3'-pyrophosphohydrolase [Acidobacteria bacterium]|nr:bifunctional (p)ppGpp synthetase/guanosine-3',5'-bis(diphosphate) 3'-pyrophosphohydrolase [Acidobacteriota bacterium]